LSAASGGVGDGRKRGSEGGGSVAPLALILEPARDLAEQVYNCVMDYKKYLDVEAALIVGGEHSDMMKGLKDGADIIVATTGKLCDMIKRGQVMRQTWYSAITDNTIVILLTLAFW